MAKNTAKPKAEPGNTAKPKAEPGNTAKPKAEPGNTAKPKAEPGFTAKPKAQHRSTAKGTSRASQPQNSAAKDWRDQTLARMRALILEADPEMIEERKWKKPSNPAGVPVWSHNGIICTGETYKQVVKLTFAKGAGIPDPTRLFNSSLEGGTRRAIDIHKGEQIDAGAFKALIKAAVAQNSRPAKKGKP